MLRPIVAFVALLAVAFVLSPAVASVHASVEGLHIKRDNVWHIFKWQEDPTPPLVPPKCQHAFQTLATDVTLFPGSMTKAAPYTMGGFARSQDKGVAGMRVDVYLNETKTAPGRLLGTTNTTSDGTWTLSGNLPFDLQARHYHIVSHVPASQQGCVVYGEAWSDPETNVTSRTHIALAGPYRAIAGHPVNISGVVTDDVGAPVTSQSVTVKVGDQSFPVNTDAGGRFVVELLPTRPGTQPVNANFVGTAFYATSDASSTLVVLDEGLVLDNMAENDTLNLTRSTPREMTGQVLVRPNATIGLVTLRFQGILVRACADCPAMSELHPNASADGTFPVTLFVDANQTAGDFTLVASATGLHRNVTYHGHLMIPTKLVVAAQDGGALSHAFSGQLVATDDVGSLVGAPVAMETPAGWASGVTNDTGGFAVQGTAAACGGANLVAHYNGTATRMPATESRDVSICGAALSTAASATRVPWWVWPLLVIAPFAAWWAYRRLRERFAETLDAGPPLTLAFDAPQDAGAGIVGVGEAASVAALLESPLPEGHRLRLGTPRLMEEIAVDELLTARYTLVPEALGDVPVRAEILDKRGRVVTRRTRPLHVVRYAAEIERRYRLLQSSHERAGRVSPREFEAWLRGRQPHIDPTVLRRLVGIFEEADYGPREAGRAELLAYLDAETASQEVAPLAME